MDTELIELQSEYLKSIPEKLDQIYELVLKLDKKENVKESISDLKGIIHSIKGTSGSYEINFLSDLCHKFEDQIESLEGGKSDVSKSFLFIDLMREYLDFFTPGENSSNEDFLKRLNNLIGNLAVETKAKIDLRKKILVISFDNFIDEAVFLALSKFNTEIEPIKKLKDLKDQKGFDFLFLDESAIEILDSIPSLIKKGLLKNPDKIFFLRSSENVKFLGKDINYLNKSYKIIKDLRDAFKSVPSKKSPNTILIVDDDESLHPLFSMAFKKFPSIKILISSSSKDALKKIEQGNIDLLMLDLMMPEINGKELFEMVRKKELKIPIIFLTGLSKPEEVKELIDLGAQGVITKPFKVPNLAGQIMDIWYKV